MNCPASEGSHTYRPSAWVRVAVGVAFLLFVGITVIAVQTALKPFYVVVSAGMAILAAIGVVELFVERVDLENDVVAIKRLFKAERIALSEVEKVSAEGGRTALLMKTGKWKKLPEWMGANMSLRRRIADKIGKPIR